MTAYSKIAMALRERILTGEWEGGERLPTEKNLCEQFHTSRITVRHALKILEVEKLVQRRQGSGTFVNANPVRKVPLVNTDFFGSIETHAPELVRRVESSCTVVASTDVAEVLHLLPSECVLEAVRVDTLRGESVATDRVYLVERFTHNLNESDLAEVDFLSRWEKAQHIELDYCSQSIEAVRSEKSVAGLLGVRTGTPVLKETNIVYLSGGSPAGLFTTFYRSDVFRFESTVDFKARHRIARLA
ncbi:MAG: hypothetical protein COA73_05620 [Candidatus Hydrogenedentota bacterium]|nr:MAG: hypothetical protein COA73_05620 [Candidatus Hydrogenedentota bacterium]